MALAPLFPIDDLSSYDGDIENSSSYTGTDALATPSFDPTPPSLSTPSSRAPPVLHHMQLEHKLSALQKYNELNLSQASDRSSSTLTFSPGAHRRSHPNLQHLSLAPLTPRYPITPSDYNAYVDPDTSQLHTSSSLSHIASMPSPGGILSQSGSRANSGTRHQKTKSTVSIQAATSTLQGALTSEGFGNKATELGDPLTRQHHTITHVEPKRSESSWLLQTGMALTEGSRESKGQSWLAKRASSTSLQAPAIGDYPNLEYAQARSGRNTPNHSRRGSRDRRKSRRELAMTPTAVTASCAAGQPSAADTCPSIAIASSASAHDYTAIEPDWADSQTQAEIAANLEMDLADELEDGELYSDDEDRYGTLDFERQDTEDDEKQVEQAVRAGGFRLGRWVDGVVDVFLKMDEVDEDDLDIKHEKPDHEAVTLPNDDIKKDDHPEQSSRQNVDDLDSDDGMEPAPQNPKSVWEDLAWFGRLVWRTAIS